KVDEKLPSFHSIAVAACAAGLLFSGALVELGVARTKERNVLNGSSCRGLQRLKERLTLARDRKGDELAEQPRNHLRNAPTNIEINGVRRTVQDKWKGVLATVEKRCEKRIRDR